MTACAGVAKTISIHALRGEGDDRRQERCRQQRHISIHALRGEGDGFPCSSCSFATKFLSTPSVGRATHGNEQCDL